MFQVGNLKCVEALEKTEKIDWNERNNLGDTPVMTALRNNNTEVVMFLLNHPKVDKSLRNTQGQPLFLLAKQKNNEELMKLFSQHIPLNEMTSYIYIRDKIIKTIPDNVFNIQKYIEEFNEGKLSSNTVSRRRGQNIKTVADFLNELENNMTICKEKGKVRELLKLIQFVHENHPSIISQELLNEVEDFSDFFEKSDYFVIFIEVGPGKKRHGLDLRRNGRGYPFANRVADQEVIVKIMLFNNRLDRGSIRSSPRFGLSTPYSID